MNFSPTPSQQRALAYAPKPLALISFLSSSYVIYHLTRKEPRKCERMYHRLVLATSIADLPRAVSWIWGTWAVPVGTPNVVGAAGTIETCTAQGFLTVMFGITLPVYYASQGVYSFLAVKNNFQQEKYQWIEKWIHAVAYLLPLSFCFLVLANESFNPRGAGCFIAGVPLGCKLDPDEQCARGGHMMGSFDIGFFMIGIVVTYLFIPPLAMMFIGFWIRRTIKEAKTSAGMRQIRVNARHHMMKDIMKQMSLYLIAFWISYVPLLVGGIYQQVTGSLNATFLIIGSCFAALQGAILTLVYFLLPRMANSSKKIAPLNANERGTSRNHLTVAKIRKAAETKGRVKVESTEKEPEEDERAFFIFDGTPSDDSPWAKFIDQGDDDENCEKYDYDENCEVA